MHHIKSELNRLLGRIEGLEGFSQESVNQFYELIERAYNIVSDSYDLDQCHSILHHLSSQLRELDRVQTSISTSRKEENSADKDKFSYSGPDKTNDSNKNMFSELKKNTANELRIFISHL